MRCTGLIMTFHSAKERSSAGALWSVAEGVTPSGLKPDGRLEEEHLAVWHNQRVKLTLAGDPYLPGLPSPVAYRRTAEECRKGTPPPR